MTIFDFIHQHIDFATAFFISIFFLVLAFFIEFFKYLKNKNDDLYKEKYEKLSYFIKFWNENSKIDLENVKDENLRNYTLGQIRALQNLEDKFLK